MANITYETNPGPFEEGIGPLTADNITSLLKACQEAIAKQYPVAGEQDVFSKVHDKGEYGAYRFTINQLIDASWLGSSAREYINKKLTDHPEGPEKLENRKSYFQYAKEYQEDKRDGTKYDPLSTFLDFAEAKIEAKNNAQYYFITNKLEGVSINNQISIGADILLSGYYQDQIAYSYLKFIYNLLYTARIIGDNTDLKVISGLLSVSLCVNYDTAAAYSRGIIKKDTNGITSKYWYDIGWNSIAETPLEVSTAKPDVPEATPVEGGATSVENTIDKVVVEYKAVGTNISGRILYDGAEIAVSMPVSIDSLSAQMEKAIQAAKIVGPQEKYQILQSAKQQIIASFETDIAPIKKQLNIVDPVSTTTYDAEGNSITTTVAVNPDGTKTTTVETVSADGNTRTKEKTQEKVVLETKTQETDITDPPATQVKNAASEEEVNKENSIETFRANNQPSNADVVPASMQDDSKGFKDPNKVYPLRSSINKPDTSPLATGINSPQVGASPKTAAGNRETLSAGASPAARNANRKREVPTAGRNGATWAQPESPYNAQYPYNKVFGSEAGHAIEIDDTPGAERLNWGHRSGSFNEIGPDGTTVTKIVGDGYTIVDKDGYILIEGVANVHVAGNCNVIIMSDTNLTMHGRISMDIHNDVDVNIGGRLSLSVGEGIYARNGGLMSLENVGDIDIDAKGNFTTDTVGKFNLTTDGGLNLTSKADTHIKSAGAFFNHSTGDMNTCTDAGIKSKSAAATEIKSGAGVNVEGAGNISLKAPLVTSSPIDTATIDVTTANITTLNAGTTNLKGTHTSTDDTTNIKGNTTASVTAPVAAAEAVCAVAAPLSNTKTVEKPVSKSVAGKSQYVGGSAGGVGGGNQGASDVTDNDVPDSPDGSADCANPNDPSNPDGPESGSGDGQTGDFGAVPATIPGCDKYYKTKQPLPALGGNVINGDIILSDNYRLRDFFKDGPISDFIPYPKGKNNKWDIIQNYRCLCLNILEPLREKYPGFRINSGFRSNTNSAHRYSAVDVQWPQYASNKQKMVEIANWVATTLPRCDQILLETANGNTAWLHIGWKLWDGRQRSGALNGTAKKLSSGKTKIVTPGRFVPW